MNNYLIIVLASLGIVWIYVCFALWIRDIKKSVQKKMIVTPKTVLSFLCNRHLRDGLMSIFLIYIGGTIFTGVTGMMVGLIASIFLSIVIRIFKI